MIDQEDRAEHRARTALPESMAREPVVFLPGKKSFRSISNSLIVPQHRQSLAAPTVS